MVVSSSDGISVSCINNYDFNSTQNAALKLANTISITWLV